jgi:hypothetical protein
VSIACKFHSAEGDGLFQETNPLTFAFHVAWHGSRRGIRLEVKTRSLIITWRICIEGLPILFSPVSSFT